MDAAEPEEWMLKAKCRGLDPNLFVPPYNPTTRQGPDPRAFAVCNGPPECPVKAQCLAYGQQHKCSGCWGGVAIHLGRRRKPRRK